MKRFMLIVFIFSIVLLTNTTSAFLESSKQLEEQLQQQMIPDEAIRLRILAHSDDEKDQNIKYIVRDRVNAYVEQTVAHIDDIEVARTTIEKTIPMLNRIVQQTLAEYDEVYDFDITYAEEVPFPLKTYGPYVYPEGNYEAILVTLGEGLGENWWCVLFPPLCFIDFFKDTTVVNADGETTSDQEEIDEMIEEQEEDPDEHKVEVRFFLFDVFNFS